MNQKPLIVILAEQDQLQDKLGLLRHGQDEDDKRGGSGTGTAKPKDAAFLGLYEETRAMEITQRQLEQSGHRQYGRVNAREKDPDQPHQSVELEHGNGMKEHPLLQTQRFDGIDNNLNPSPPNNPDSLWIYENERQEQDKEKQLRLGNELTKRNEYQPSFVPTPRPGG